MRLPCLHYLARRRRAALPAILLALACSTAPGQSFWPQFRGPMGQGVSSTAQPPVAFTKADALWTTDVAPGYSSPVVWGDKIFLTCIENGKLDCRAYDRATGKLLWTRPVPAEKIEATHAFSNPAASTAAADADRVIFYFGSYGLLAFSHDGKPLWEKKLPTQVSRGGYGTATSPIICNDLVVLACDTDQGGSRLLAFKRATGDAGWETPRPLFTAGWSTPVLWARDGQTEILVLGSKKLTAYDPAKGKELWSLPGFTLETACSPAFEGDMLFVCAAGLGGRSSQKFDFSGWKQLLTFDTNHDGKIQFDEIPEDFHLVIRAELPAGHPGRELPFNTREVVKGMDDDKDGALSEQEWNKAMEGFENMDVPVVMALWSRGVEKAEDRIAWRYGRGIPEIPSPLAYHGKLYLVRDGGVLQCMDEASGAVVYQERLGAPGGYAASPVAAQDHVYFASQAGIITVIDGRSDTLKVLAQNSLDEKVAATPALVEKAIYIRTDKHLLAFANK